jgi:hypothetical protein
MSPHHIGTSHRPARFRARHTHPFPSQGIEAGRDPTPRLVVRKGAAPACLGGNDWERYRARISNCAEARQGEAEAMRVVERRRTLKNLHVWLRVHISRNFHGVG